jgi:tRNA pseudouridine38-40 synthase
MRYRATLSYDGTNYGGWQIQPNAITIQQRLQEALSELTQAQTTVHGSGRTDAGVHARAQVAHFDSETELAASKMLRGVNALLPKDIRVQELTPVDPEFHARFGAVKKEYRYHIWNAPEVPPFIRFYRHHVRAGLDLTAMQAAAAVLVGEHDFVSFSANPKREMDGTVRILHELSINPSADDSPELMIRAVGNGFLYKMVRSLAGFLIRVGMGSLEAEQAQAFLEQTQRTHDIPTAPALGLFLWQVDY